MIRVGITGQAGFVGSHLYNLLGLRPESYERIAFEDAFFEEPDKLRAFVRRCDAIVHLAAMNRHPDEQVIYNTNIELVEKLILAMEKEKVTPHVLFSSSTQETLDNLYGKSKFQGRQLLEKWAERNNASFSGLVIPNVFGEFSKPNYNTFVATFAHKLITGEQPKILNNINVRLIYVGSLCEHILKLISNKSINRIDIPFDFESSVSEILALFERFKADYIDKGIIPAMADQNEINLFNTFRSYIDYKTFFPVKLQKHADHRGAFVETIKLGIGGQVSFSTTLPGITRGNHFHTRKIERFTVIKGKAQIQLRKIGTDEIISFDLDGDEPSHVDMPVWYTHNITNTGSEELYTQFWISEWYNPDDADTFFEKV